MNFDFLQKYIVEPNSKKRLRHTFHPVKASELALVEDVITIPVELKKFYTLIGSGFLLDTVDESIDKLLDPVEFKKINLKEDFFEFDPTLEIFSLPMFKDKLIFFVVNEGVYLLIDKNDINGHNPIFYFDEKIANSLEEFLLRFDEEPYFFEKN
jgi:hypothetical protein